MSDRWIFGRSNPNPHFPLLFRAALCCLFFSPMFFSIARVNGGMEKFTQFGEFTYYTYSQIFAYRV